MLEVLAKAQLNVKIFTNTLTLPVLPQTDCGYKTYY